MAIKIINVIDGKSFFSSINEDLGASMDEEVNITDLMGILGITDIMAVRQEIQPKDVVGCRLSSQRDADTMAKLLRSGQYLVDYQVDVDATRTNARHRRCYARFDVYRVSDPFCAVNGARLLDTYFPKVELDDLHSLDEPLIMIGDVEMNLGALMNVDKPIDGLVNIDGNDYYVVNRPVTEFIDKIRYIPNSGVTAVFCVDTLRMSRR